MNNEILKRYLWVGGALLAFLFAWNAQSLWIDECYMVISASQKSFHDVWIKVTDIGGSDTQMACYMYLLHIWIKLTGADSEMLLRLYNVLWVFLAAFFLRKEPKILLILVVSPFFIYYANELRPYVMQIAASCGITVFLYKKKKAGEEVSYYRGLGLFFLLCTTSLTSVVWSIGFLAAWIILEGRKFWTKKLWKAVACWFLPVVCLGGYYLYTLLIGARAAYIHSNAFVNLGASVYELFGVTGLGPARSDLRLCTHVSDLFNQNGLLIPIWGALLVGCVVLWGLYSWRRQSSNALLISMAVLLIIPLTIFMYSSEMMGFRFSGRHLAPIFPLVCTVISYGLKWSKNNPIQSIISTLFVCIWVGSDINIRFNDNYAREDYRGAIEYCEKRKVSGDQVLLLCDSACKLYYKWKDSHNPRDWNCCQSIVVTRPADFVEIVKEIEFSGNYTKRKLSPSFWVYESKRL